MSKPAKTADESNKEAPAEKEHFQLNVLAFLLTALPKKGDDELETSMAMALESRLGVWRTDREYRSAWRKLAREFMKLLGAHGLRLKVSNSTTLEKALHDICTIPAKQAYDPTTET